MNEKLQYATMLEIPVNTCTVTYKPTKKKRFAKRKNCTQDQVKEQLVNKVNAITAEQTCDQQLPSIEQNSNVEYNENAIAQSVQMPEKQERTEKSFKFSAIGVQLCIIGVLIATIFLTNAIYADSAMNVFFKSLFTVEQTATIDNRSYDEFSPVIALGEDLMVNLEEGVMSFSGKGSVYSPCDGTISKLSVGEDGKYTLEITHSDNFKSVLTGIDFAYTSVSQKVYSNIPLGYVLGEGATMCFMDVYGQVISNYTIVENTVVWAV